MAGSINHWVKECTECEIPVMQKSLQRLQMLQEEEKDITISVLTSIARQDPGFSITLLRHAGMKTKREITTLSHAISLISIPVVIKMLLQSPVLEKVIAKDTVNNILNIYTYLFQIGFITREWSQLRKESETNEVFTAGLNRGFFRFMLYMIDPEKAVKLNEIYHSNNKDHKKNEKDLLGENVDVISEQIAKKWALPELIRESYSGKHHNPKITGIRLASEYMHYVYMTQSVNYEEDLLNRTAEYMRTPAKRTPGKLNSLLIKMTRSGYPYVPTQPILGIIMCYPGSIKKVRNNAVATNEIDKKKILSKAISDLRNNTPQKSTKELIQIAVNTMNLAIGFERVLFFSYNRNEKILNLAIRKLDSDIKDVKHLSISLELNRLFRQLMSKNQLLMITKKNQHKYSGLLPNQLQPLTPSASSVINSFYINNKAAGCIFVDFGKSNRNLSSKDIETYKLICKELKAAIELSINSKQTTRKVA